MTVPRLRTRAFSFQKPLDGMSFKASGGPRELTEYESTVKSGTGTDGCR